MTRPVTLESSRSRQTGQDGSSNIVSSGTPLSSEGKRRELYTVGGNAGMAVGGVPGDS